MANVPLPPLQSPPATSFGSFDPLFYAFLKSLLRRVDVLEAQNTALKVALNEVRQNPTTVYPGIE